MYNLCVRVRVCVPMPTHITIKCLWFRARRIDGVECGLFSIYTQLGQTILRVGRISVYSSVLEEAEVRMNVCVTECVV